MPDVLWHHRHNLIIAYTPLWLVPWVSEKFPGVWRDVEAPPYVEELLDAPYMDIWDIPPLSAPSCPGNILPPGAPLLFALYAFTGVEPRFKVQRDLFRQYSPLKTVPAEYRHLFEVKFAMGRSLDPEQEKALDQEQAEHGDLVRLDGLINGENMDSGKSLHWLRWAGLNGTRPAYWTLYVIYLFHLS